MPNHQPRDNPFNEASLKILIEYFKLTNVDFGVEEVITRAELEVSSSGESGPDSSPSGADQPRSDGAEDNSNGLLLRRWLRSSRGVAPKKLRYALEKCGPEESRRTDRSG
jgi:hypothetical protein